MSLSSVSKTTEDVMPVLCLLLGILLSSSVTSCWSSNNSCNLSSSASLSSARCTLPTSFPFLSWNGSHLFLEGKWFSFPFLSFPFSILSYPIVLLPISLPILSIISSRIPFSIPSHPILSFCIPFYFFADPILSHPFFFACPASIHISLPIPILHIYFFFAYPILSYLSGSLFPCLALSILFRFWFKIWESQSDSKTILDVLFFFLN